MGHVENLIQYQTYNLDLKSSGKKNSKTNNNKIPELDQTKTIEKQEKIFENDLINVKSLNKEEVSNKNENDSEILGPFNSKEKNTITVELSDDEKFVYSQLGINPLIKLGKEYITSNNIARLEANNTKENVSNNDLKSAKKVSHNKQVEKISKNDSIDTANLTTNEDAKSKKKLPLITNKNTDIEFIEKNKEVESIEEMNNMRKKRRRSSANSE